MSDSDISGPYWAGAARGELVVQRCSDCGALRHYPRMLCDACYSFDWTPTPIGRRGELYSWTVTDHAFLPEFAGELPYVLATVTMAPCVRVLGRLHGADDLVPGMALALSFERDGSGAPMPVFVPA